MAEIHGMNAALAIYEALLQANVSAPAARGVAEALEKDMTTVLVTRQDFQHFEQLMSTKMEALESRIDLKLQNLESRLVVKLGILMTVLFSLAGGLLAFLR